jgi:hypothetical protein
VKASGSRARIEARAPCSNTSRARASSGAGVDGFGVRALSCSRASLALESCADAWSYGRLELLFSCVRICCTVRSAAAMVVVDGVDVVVEGSVCTVAATGGAAARWGVAGSCPWPVCVDGDGVEAEDELGRVEVLTSFPEGAIDCFSISWTEEDCGSGVLCRLTGNRWATWGDGDGAAGVDGDDDEDGVELARRNRSGSQAARLTNQPLPLALTLSGRPLPVLAFARLGKKLGPFPVASTPAPAPAPAPAPDTTSKAPLSSRPTHQPPPSGSPRVAGVLTARLSGSAAVLVIFSRSGNFLVVFLACNRGAMFVSSVPHASIRALCKVL